MNADHLRKLFIGAFCFLSVPIICGAQTPKPTPDKERAKVDAEYRRKHEELEKKLAEDAAKVKEFNEKREKIKVLLDAGLKAFNEKDYQLAVNKFNEALQSTDFWPEQVTLLSNKSSALLMIGIEKTNGGTRQQAYPYMQESIDCLDKVLQLVEINKGAVEPDRQKIITANRYLAARARAENYYLFASVNSSQIPKAIAALDSYIKIETDGQLKATAIENLQTLKSRLADKGKPLPK
jgi:tetratricopeptide (TPR) repeat protein